MIIQHIAIDPDDQSLVVSAQNNLGFSLSVRISRAQLGTDGVSAVETLRGKAQGLLPADPPAGVLDQIRGLEEQLVALRASAGISQPEVLL